MSKQQPQPLYSAEAEEATLGALLVDPEAIHAVACIVRPADFYIVKHRWLYEAMLALADRRESVDTLTICGELERRGHLADVGGTAHIVDLVNVTPSAMHVESYAQQVAGDAQRRRLVQAAGDIVKLAHDRAAGIEDLTADAEGALLRAVIQGNGHIKDARGLMDTIYRRAEAYHADPLPDGRVRHLDTGWSLLNKALGGWRPGLYVVLAVPHLGKTWFCLNTVAHACHGGKRALYFPLEMTAEQLTERLCISYAHATQQQYERGVMDQAQWKNFLDRMAGISEWDLLIDDEASTIGQIVAVANREHLKKPLDLIVVDSLGLLQGGSGENRNLEIGHYTRRLKLLARDLNVPILAPHHVSDKIVSARTDKRPKPADAYESGHVGQDADGLLGLYRDDFYEPKTRPHIMDVFVLKDRLGGGTGQWVELYFSPWGEITSVERRTNEPAFD